MITFDKVKEFLQEEIDLRESEFNLLADVIPIMHNKDFIYLQFNGCSINLKSDGTWEWEDTTGG